MYFYPRSRTWTRHGKVPNAVMMAMLAAADFNVLVIEKIEPYGMMGRTTLDTVFLTGQMSQLAKQVEKPVVLIPRRIVKKTLVGKSTRVKDGQIRQWLIDYYDKGEQLRTKGIAADAWSALALGTAYSLLYAKR